MKQDKQDTIAQEKRKFWIMIKILFALFIFSIIIAAVIISMSDTESYDYNTAIISVTGPLSTGGDESLFSAGSASSTEIVAQLEKARQDPQITAIIIEIDSPGGSPVATDEIAQKIKEIRSDNITVVAWIRESGASGAYWVASSTEYIVANRMSIVGSIGVTGSYLEWYGLMNKYNVTYKRMVAGAYKDSGTPLRPMSSAEEKYLQEKLDKLHEIFISEVAQNRNMSVAHVEKLATGEIFLGIEAKENGLIDELGGEAQAITYIELKTQETVKTKAFAPDKGFIESLMSTMHENSFYIGQGIASGFMTTHTSGIQLQT